MSADVRARFPVLERFAYLNAGTLGPLSRATIAAMEERNRFDHEHGRGGKAWFESMLALRQRVRETLAQEIGAAADKLALTSSTTDGCNLVAAGFGLRPDDEVVTTNSEHPGLLLPLHASGAKVRVAEITTRPTSEALEAILAERELELHTLRGGLISFEAQYDSIVSRKYEELDELRVRIAETSQLKEVDRGSPCRRVIL